MTPPELAAALEDAARALAHRGAGAATVFMAELRASIDEGAA